MHSALYKVVYILLVHLSDVLGACSARLSLRSSCSRTLCWSWSGRGKASTLPLARPCGFMSTIKFSYQSSTFMCSPCLVFCMHDFVKTKVCCIYPFHCNLIKCGAVIAENNYFSVAVCLCRCPRVKLPLECPLSPLYRPSFHLEAHKTAHLWVPLFLHFVWAYVVTAARFVQNKILIWVLDSFCNGASFSPPHMTAE